MCLSDAVAGKEDDFWVKVAGYQLDIEETEEAPAPLDLALICLEFGLGGMTTCSSNVAEVLNGFICASYFWVPKAS